ncbi:HtaA domain-containing protein [Solirubrobacter sp. CPCC 204708]|uniref:HtaA domain-containing protein n=1 Tax=Solirubrobacter deserti TaxID=2282478 RepID=A0ABT4RFB7_9ACTN|nr:HtaA domain-containing protein [Solirubrobacter deserti]MBE2319525.1 HtaA domain-containing protein [Solirubrobacter deserti]MDA0137188.1 HtaA domain-containing protein [Solirubrobacter deserti]
MFRTALAGAALAALALPAAAAADTTVTLKGSALSALKRQGVKVSAVAPATLRGSKLTLPVASGTVGTTATLTHDGALRLRAGRRAVTLTRWQATLGSSSRLTARIAGTRRTAFTVRTTASNLSLGAAAGTVRVSSARVTLTKAGATAIRKALRLERVKTGTFGTTSVDAAFQPGTTTPTAPASPTTPGSGGPATTPITNEPSPLARPATAVAITSASVTWRVRDSFVQYVSAGTASGDGASAVAPAVADPPSQGCSSSGGVNPAQLRYQYQFPFREGWYDPASGQAALYFNGAVHFGYRAHTIDFNAKEPEVEINGAASRMIFRFDGSGGTDAGNKRAVLVNLDTAKGPAPAACSVDPGPAGIHNPAGTNNTYVYERIAGIIPEGAADSVFAGFYLPGDQFGWMTLTFTT